MNGLLLLSTAYSWFIGLLAIMVLMAVLFIVIAIFALRPFKMGGVSENIPSDAVKLLEDRESELTLKLLNNANDEEATAQLREVSSAKMLVKELIAMDNGESVPVRRTYGVDSSLTEEEALSLENGDKVSIEQTFESSAKDDGVNKSFSAKLIQSNDEIKVWYFELKNNILCYEKTVARMNWNNEKFYIGRTNVATLTIRGKQLCLYLAVDANEYSDRYPVKDSTSDMYKESTPCLFRIKNEKCLKQAKEMLSYLMSDYGVMYVRTNHSIYAMPYEDDDTLFAKGLMKKD